MLPYVTVWLGYANIFIAVFIMTYAFLFLKQTNAHRDRRPWDFLFVASFLYLLYQIANVAYLSDLRLLSDVVDMTLVSNVMAFLYSSCVLLAFISQHDLILRSELILISKRDHKEAEGKVEVKIGLPTKKHAADDTVKRQPAK